VKVLLAQVGIFLNVGSAGKGLPNKRIKSDAASRPIFCNKQTAQKRVQHASQFMRALIAATF